MKWVTMRYPKSGGVHVFPERTQQFRESQGWELVADDLPTPAGPARPAKNATTEAWREYAAAVGVSVTEEMTRDEIVAAVDEQEA